MTTFVSRIKLGKMYKDQRTGIEGYADVLAFQPHGCVEVVLEYMKDGKPDRHMVNELRLVAPNDAPLEFEKHEYETDLVMGHQYQDIETGLKGHLAIVEFHEFMATRGILRSLVTDQKGRDEVKYHSIDDFLLRDMETQTVAEPKTEKKSPARSSTALYER